MTQYIFVLGHVVVTGNLDEVDDPIKLSEFTESQILAKKWAEESGGEIYCLVPLETLYP